MTTTFDFCLGDFMCLIGTNDITLKRVELPLFYRTLNEAIDEAENLIKFYDCNEVACCKDTGEVIFIAKKREEYDNE